MGSAFWCCFRGFSLLCVQSACKLMFLLFLVGCVLGSVFDSGSGSGFFGVLKRLRKVEKGWKRLFRAQVFCRNLRNRLRQGRFWRRRNCSTSPAPHPQQPEPL